MRSEGCMFISQVCRASNNRLFTATEPRWVLGMFHFDSVSAHTGREAQEGKNVPVATWPVEPCLWIYMALSWPFFYLVILLVLDFDFFEKCSSLQTTPFHGRFGKKCFWAELGGGGPTCPYLLSCLSPHLSLTMMGGRFPVALADSKSPDSGSCFPSLCLAEFLCLGAGIVLHFLFSVTLGRVQGGS